MEVSQLHSGAFDVATSLPPFAVESGRPRSGTALPVAIKTDPAAQQLGLSQPETVLRKSHAVSSFTPSPVLLKHPGVAVRLFRSLSRGPETSRFLIGWSHRRPGVFLAPGLKPRCPRLFDWLG